MQASWRSARSRGELERPARVLCKTLFHDPSREKHPMSWRRTALVSAGVFVVAAAAGAIALHALVDPERLKHVARDKAAHAWSRDLAVGEMSLSLLPWPALTARDVALANPSWAKSRNLVQVDLVVARLELLPLLVGKARIASLDLEGVKAALEVSPDGKVSWDLGSASSPQARGDASSETDLLALEALRVRNADIVYKPKSGPAISWRIEEAIAQGASGLRNVRIEASFARRQRPLKLKAEIEDLSRVGHAGATSGGKIALDWGQAQLAIEGRFPLEAGLKGLALKADFKASSFTDMLAFFDLKQGRTAAASARLEARESQGWIDITQFAGTLGTFKFIGDAKVSASGPRTVVKGRLDGDRLAWERFLLDLGFPAIPGLEPDEMFHDNPLAWPLLVSLQGSSGSVELKLRSLVLRNGVELRNLKSSLAFENDRLDAKAFSAEMLGGSGSGTMAFEGRKKLVHVNFDGTSLLLERWFRERAVPIPFTGGPMTVKAVFMATGDSLKGLAATVTGPITIRMGRGTWASDKAGHAETVMTSAFSHVDASSIEFECVSLSMPFSNGKASSKSILGARSTASQLLTSGTIDLRDESLDLHGRVQPRSGKVGLATIAGDIQISGKLRHPHASLDSIGAPAAVVRAGVAVATAGLSLVGTAEADAADAKKNDACEAVFR
jgi:AsmA family protein